MPAPEASKELRVRRMRHRPGAAIGATFDRFFAERGTHLAAMVAYFALASFVPLIFLALSLLGFLDQADSSSALVSYLEDIFPDQSVESIVNVVDAVQRNATTLSVVGAVALLWSSLSLFSALESAFNILYGRPNRPFLRGKVARDRLHDRRARRPLRRASRSGRSATTCSAATRPTSSRTSGSRLR